MSVVGSESSSSSDPGLFSIVAVKIFSFITARIFIQTYFTQYKYFKIIHVTFVLSTICRGANREEHLRLSVLKKKIIAIENNQK